VHVQDLFAAADVGQADHHLAVETARTQQRLVQHVGAVGGGDHDHAGVGFETVHLHQHLVQGLLALVVAAAHAGTTMAADGVDFVDEDDGERASWRSRTCRAREAPTPTNISTKSEPEMVKNGTLASPAMAGPAGFYRYPGTDHQHAAGNAAAQLLELGRVAQEVDQLRLLPWLRRNRRRRRR
jgi:hypothetical protein